MNENPGFRSLTAMSSAALFIGGSLLVVFSKDLWWLGVAMVGASLVIRFFPSGLFSKPEREPTQATDLVGVTKKPGVGETRANPPSRLEGAVREAAWRYAKYGTPAHFVALTQALSRLRGAGAQARPHYEPTVIIAEAEELLSKDTALQQREPYEHGIARGDEYGE